MIRAIIACSFSPLPYSLFCLSETEIFELTEIGTENHTVIKTEILLSMPHYSIRPNSTQVAEIIQGAENVPHAQELLRNHRTQPITIEPRTKNQYAGKIIFLSAIMLVAYLNLAYFVGFMLLSVLLIGVSTYEFGSFPKQEEPKPHSEGILKRMQNLKQFKE